MRNRKIWLDIAKGITIILMVLGHTSIPDYLSDFIYAFHMPLFFIASGYITNWNKYNTTRFIYHKFKSLIIPFTIYSTIVLCICNLIRWNNSIDIIKNGWGGYALWFIPVLFCSTIIVKLIYLIRFKSIKYLICITLAIIGIYLCHNHISLPWSIANIPYASCLIVCGQKLKSYEVSLERAKLLYAIPLFVITAIVSQYWHLDMAFNNIKPFIPITIGAISGTLMTFIIAIYIDKRCKILSMILQRIGRNTFIIVAFSQIIIILLNKYYDLNFFIKYLLLVIILIFIQYIKTIMIKLISNGSKLQ